MFHRGKQTLPAVNLYSANAGNNTLSAYMTVRDVIIILYNVMSHRQAWFCVV